MSSLIEMNDFTSLIIGIVCAGIGGDLFVRGAVGLASWARISPGIIGATVAAFATSSPELSVSISASLAGEPEIAFGDALGSNIINVALILALALLVSGVQCSRGSVKRDFPVALSIPLLTGVLCLDGELSRFDGVLMLSIFFAWLVATTIDAKSQRSAAEVVLAEHRGPMVLLSCAGGLAFLVAAGSLIVTGAQGIAVSFGIDEFVIGATIVAVGTSVPELATTIMAKFRGHDEVGLGTILGSNIFNGLLIVAVASIIHPIPVARSEVTVTLVFGLVALTLAYPTRDGFINRTRGACLLVLFVAYVLTTLR